MFDTLSGHCIASSGAILNFFFFLFFSRAAVGGEGGGKGGSCLKRERTNERTRKTGEIDKLLPRVVLQQQEHREGFHPDPDKVAHHQRALPAEHTRACLILLFTRQRVH